MLSIAEYVIATQVGHSSLRHSDLPILIVDQLGRSLICLHGAGQVSSTWTPKDGELDTQMCPCSPGTLTTLALCLIGCLVAVPPKPHKTLCSVAEVAATAGIRLQ